MLRLLVIALVLANALFFAWTQGALDHVMGARSIGDREPERLEQQVRPGDLAVLSAPSASSAASAAAATRAAARTECLEAGPYTEPQLPAIEAAVASAWPGLAWSRRQTELPGSWVLAMGPFANRELLDRKKEELRRVRVTFEELKAPAAFNGALSLGRFESTDAASAALAQLATRGIKTARVAQLGTPSVQVRLRAEVADPAVAAQVRGVKAETWAPGSLAACP